MNRLSQRLAILVLSGGCFNTSLLSAQTPPPAQQEGVVQVGATVVLPNPNDPVGSENQNRPFHRWFNKHGMSCASNFNQLGCGNLWSNTTFIFGSCRTFFGQPCYPNPPGGAHIGNGSLAGPSSLSGPNPPPPSLLGANPNCCGR